MAVGARHCLRLPFCCWQEPHPLLPLPARRYMILYICYTFALILSYSIFRLPFCCWQGPHPLLPLPTCRYMILYICYIFVFMLFGSLIRLELFVQNNYGKP